MAALTADESVFTGDPAKLAAASYDAIHTALAERLTALETQKDLAASAAFSH